jgi:hypothetical protein
MTTKRIFYSAYVLLDSSGHTRALESKSIDLWRWRVHPSRSALCRFITSVLPTNHLFGHGGP